jgi:hypothetical protein
MLDGRPAFHAKQEAKMKNLTHSSFLRLFDLLFGAGNPGTKLSSWTHRGVLWERERHSFTGPKHGLSIEIVTVSRPGKRGWSLMVVKEFWWAGNENKALKSLHWAKPVAGRPGDDERSGNYGKGTGPSVRHHETAVISAKRS